MIDLPYGLSAYLQQKFPAICDLNNPPRGEIQAFDSKDFTDKAYDDTCGEVYKVMTSINLKYKAVRKYGLACLIRRNRYPAIVGMQAR